MTCLDGQDYGTFLCVYYKYYYIIERFVVGCAIYIYTNHVGAYAMCVSMGQVLRKQIFGATILGRREYSGERNQRNSWRTGFDPGVHHP